jgi:MFS family permease
MAARFIPEHHKATKAASQSYQNLLRRSEIVFPIATAFLFFALTAGLNFLLPFYLDNILKTPPSQAGLIMGITPIVLGLLSPISGMLADRIGTRHITTTGCLVAAAGFCSLFFLQPQTPSLLVIAILVPQALGLALFQTANNSAILNSVPRHQTGITSSLVGFSRTLGFASGIAFFSSLLSLQHSLDENIPATHPLFATSSFSAIHTVFIVLGITSIVAAIIGITSSHFLRKGQPQ